MAKRLFLLLLCSLAVVCGFTQNEFGTNLTWSFNATTGTLTIGGSGEMDDCFEGVPWYDKKAHIQRISIGSGVTTIGGNAFSETSDLASINIPGGIKSIGGMAFSSCWSLTTVTMGGNVAIIGDDAFAACSSLESITIPKSVTNIGERAFKDCTNLTTVNYNAIDCTVMGSADEPVFFNCNKLTEINIGSEVESIPANAFSGCTGIEHIYAENIVPPTVGSAAFSNETKLSCILHIPAGSKIHYKNADEWKDFINIDEKELDITVSDFSVTITWTAVKEAVKYTLTLYSDDGNTNEIDRFQLDAGELSCTIPNLNPATTYYYSLVAYDASNVELTVVNGEFKTTGEIGIEALTLGTISLSPNPATDYIYVRGAEESTLITLSDISGKVVLKTITAPNEAVSVAHLPRGVYMFQAAGETVKLIKF